MKKLILSIVSFGILFATQAVAQQRIYVCEGFRYDVHEVRSTDDIVFSADGLELSIGDLDTYELDDIVTKGRQYSQSTFSAATAREQTKSNFSLYSLL